jgi:cytoskeletal protein CcmA (bactofilin family)
MWNKQESPTESPATTSSAGSGPSATRLGNASPRGGARLGASLEIKGQITGEEDLQIDGRVTGAISLNGHELTVGPNAQLHSEIHAGDLIVSGKVVGNVHARGRVDIRKDGSVTGDVASARISIEDGAHFKGRIEIDPAKSKVV